MPGRAYFFYFCGGGEMENMLMWFKGIFALLGGMITAFLGGWDLALKILVGFVILDFVVGIVAATMQGKVNSHVGQKFARKILLFIPIGIGYMLDALMGQEILRNLAIFFYLANEGISLLENLGKCGVPIPEPIFNALEQLNGKGDNTDAAKRD